MTAKARPVGNNVASIVVRWQRGDGKRTRWQDDRTFTFKAGSDGQLMAQGLVTVPRNAEQLVVLLDVHHQISDGDVCWFDDVGIHRVK